MTWDAYNRRKIALREVLAIADLHREDANATHLLEQVEGANAAFDNEIELLRDVQMNWYQRLSGQMDRTVSEGAADLEMLATDAWSAAAAEMQGARALLDANEDLPELHKAFAKEQDFLGRAAGLPGNHPDLLAHGQRIKDAARAQYLANTVEIAEIPDTPAGLFGRIREAFAA